MKKSRLLALTLVVAIALMGAGYAYWTQTLTIENTVTTGYLDVAFEGADVVKVDRYMNEEISDFGAGSTDYEVEGVFYDAYPEAEIKVKFDLVNRGTMKAFVRSFAVTGVNKDFILVKECVLNTVPVEFTGTPTLDTFLNDEFDTLNNNYGIVLGVKDKQGDPTDRASIEMTLIIDPRCDSDTLGDFYLVQNSADIENAEPAIVFNIGAKAHQHNSDEEIVIPEI